jgi:hypothetical protein
MTHCESTTAPGCDTGELEAGRRCDHCAFRLQRRGSTEVSWRLEIALPYLRLVVDPGGHASSMVSHPMSSL